MSVVNDQIGDMINQMLAYSEELDEGDTEHLDDVLDYLDEMDDINEIKTITKCPECKRTYNIVHSECGEYVDLCTCILPTDHIYHCFSCSITFDREDSWDILTPASWEEPYVYTEKPLPLPNTNGLIQPKQVVKECNHNQTKMNLNGDISIYCSSVSNCGKGQVDPDFGLYADHSWRPAWRNEFILWPDYGLPTDKDLAIKQIQDAYERILLGERVEIGCIGGHGRTGTILAIFYIIANHGEIKSEEAIKWVKQSYCNHAIETEGQKWYIQYASNALFNEPLDEQPSTKAKPKEQHSHAPGGFCTITDHFAMMLQGHKDCYRFEDCPSWDTDEAMFGQEGKLEIIKTNARNLMKNYPEVTND